MRVPGSARCRGSVAGARGGSPPPAGEGFRTGRTVPDVHGTGRATGPKSSGSRARTTPPWVRRARKTSTRCPGRTTRRRASAGTSSRGTSGGAPSVPGGSTVPDRHPGQSAVAGDRSRYGRAHGPWNLRRRHRRDDEMNPWRPRFTLQFARRDGGDTITHARRTTSWTSMSSDRAGDRATGGDRRVARRRPPTEYASADGHRMDDGQRGGRWLALHRAAPDSRRVPHRARGRSPLLVILPDP